jgi:hypothetical protein
MRAGAMDWLLASVRVQRLVALRLAQKIPGVHARGKCELTGRHGALVLSPGERKQVRANVD